MAELPALPLGAPEPRERVSARPGPRPKLQGPGTAAQAERLGPALARITDAFESGRVTASEEPAAAPEQVLVLEVAGELTDFTRAIDRIPGLEFLVEAVQERVESGAEFAAVDHEGKEHRYDRLLYLVFSDHAAWQELLGLWKRFQKGEGMPYGKAPFAHMFSRLEDLRPWNDRDRLERSGALDAWARELAELPDEPVQLEIELWLRAEEDRRAHAMQELTEDLERHGGRVLSEYVRPEISYHGVLAEVPARLIAETVERRDVRWARTSSIRFFHAVGQLAVSSEEGEPQAAVEDVAQRPLPATDEPRLAILDGVPLAGHALLAGRITVDDPDEWEALVEVSRRNHGTAIASLVIHGDLNTDGEAQPSQVYLRPILWDQTPSWVHGEGREELPRDRLAVDVVHSAIARMYEGEQPAAPGVRIVVLALGDSACQFDRFISPLARLIDWLQASYEILILVSAGNHTDDLALPADLDGSDPQELQHEVLSALARNAGMRRLLSPAESINALTIGAAHSDGAAYRNDDGRIEPVLTPDLPTVCSAHGAGVRRSVKPDLLLPGGRQLLTRQPKAGGAAQTFSVSATRRPPGLRAAAPGRQAGVLDATGYSTGTSAATALAGHHAGHLLAMLEELRTGYRAAMPGPEFDAVLVKAALVHSAAWGSARGFIEQASDGLDAKRSRELAARMIGYGRADPAGVLVCDDHRATALAASRLTDGQAHAYRFPLPEALAAVTDDRRLTLTMAWLTPINPEHRLYRRAALDVEPAGLPARFAERIDVEAYPARRGTVQHEVLTGRRAVPYAPGADLELLVSCRADAGSLASSVPYAILVTLETPENVSLPIYQQVREGLRVPVAVRPAP